MFEMFFLQACSAHALSVSIGDTETYWQARKFPSNSLLKKRAFCQGPNNAFCSKIDFGSYRILLFSHCYTIHWARWFDRRHYLFCLSPGFTNAIWEFSDQRILVDSVVDDDSATAFFPLHTDKHIALFRQHHKTKQKRMDSSIAFHTTFL